MSIVRSADFSTGDFKVSNNRFTADDIAAFIARYQREYLVKLLGAELYALFVEDLTGTPQSPDTARFTVLFEENQWDLNSCGPTISQGIKYMLQGCIYYHYVKDHNLVHTITGMVSPANENSVAEAQTKGMQYITQKYAAALDTYSAIQAYIDKNAADYPEYNGVAINQIPFYF